MRDVVATFQDLVAASDAALRLGDVEGMRELLSRATAMRVALPQADQMRRLLQLPIQQRLQWQLKVALAHGNVDGVVRATMAIKRLFFAETPLEFDWRQFEGLRSSEEWEEANAQGVALDDDDGDDVEEAQEGPRVLPQLHHSGPRPVPRTSVLALQPAQLLVPLAVQTARDVLCYTGELPVTYPRQVAQEMVARGLAHPALRDEMLAQLLRHLTQNKSVASVTRGWQLLLLLLSSFPPGEAFENYVERFLRRQGENHCLAALHRTVFTGARLEPPSLEEIEALEATTFAAVDLVVLQSAAPQDAATGAGAGGGAGAGAGSSGSAELQAVATSPSAMKRDGAEATPPGSSERGAERASVEAKQGEGGGLDVEVDGTGRGAAAAAGTEPRPLIKTPRLQRMREARRQAAQQQGSKPEPEPEPEAEVETAQEIDTAVVEQPQPPTTAPAPAPAMSQPQTARASLLAARGRGGSRGARSSRGARGGGRGTARAAMLARARASKATTAQQQQQQEVQGKDAVEQEPAAVDAGGGLTSAAVFGVPFGVQPPRPPPARTAVEDTADDGADADDAADDDGVEATASFVNPLELLQRARG